MCVIRTTYVYVIKIEIHELNSLSPKMSWFDTNHANAISHESQIW